MSAIQPCPSSISEYSAKPAKGYRCSVALVAGVAKRITIPSGAFYAIFAATDHVVAKWGDGAVAATWVADNDTGDADDLDPTQLTVPQDGSTHLSLIANSTCYVVVTFLKKILG